MDCINTSYSNDNFIINLSMVDQEIDKSKYRYDHYAPADSPLKTNSWLIRVSLNQEGGFEQKLTKKNSMFIHNEFVKAVFEYTFNKIILSLDPSKLLIVENWKPIRIIPPDFKGNTDKFYLLPHPEFDEFYFPFMICSGFYQYELINVRDFTIEKFIDGSCC